MRGDKALAGRLRRLATVCDRFGSDYWNRSATDLRAAADRLVEDAAAPLSPEQTLDNAIVGIRAFKAAAREAGL